MKFINLLSVLLVCASVSSQSALADTPALKQVKYGELVQNPVTMEGTITNNFVCHNSGGFTAGVDNTKSHSGTSSYAIDCHSATGNILFEANTIKSISDMSNNALYFEMYLSGFNEKPSNLSFYTHYIDEAGVYSKPDGFSMTCEAADENGWHKVWGLAPAYAFDKIRFGVNYTYSSGDSMSKLYIDDMSVRMVPVLVSAFGMEIDKSTFSRDDLILYGYNSKGVASQIYSLDLADFTPQNTNITYDKQTGTFNLSKNHDGFNSTINVNFLGATGSFKMSLFGENKDVTLSGGSYSDGVYRAVISNNTDFSRNIKYAICIFDGTRLSSFEEYSVDVEANDTVNVENTVSIPFYASSPTVKGIITSK